MKQTILISAFFFVALFSKAQDSTKVLTEGTVITIELQQDISSKTNHVGDVLEFLTSEPVIIGDRVLVAKGTPVSGVITDCAKAKGLGKQGKLNFDINYLRMPSGKNVKLTSEIKTEGKNKAGTAVAEAVLLTPLFLLKKGKNIKFEKGHIFKVFVEETTTL